MFLKIMIVTTYFINIGTYFFYQYLLLEFHFINKVFFILCYFIKSLVNLISVTHLNIYLFK